MTIFYCGGHKGGDGKSMSAAVLTDLLLVRDQRAVALIEGDLGQPDIALRYERRIAVRAVNLNQSGASEKAVIKFAEALDKLGDADIVVNLPAAAEDTLDALAALLVEAGSALGHDTRVFYNIGHQATATAAALKSLKAGLLGAAHARCVIYPEFLQPDVSRFDFVRSGARDQYLETGGLEAVMPAMRPEDLVDHILGLKGSFTDLAKPDSQLSFGERLFFGRQWLPEAHKAVATLVDLNVKNDDEVAA